MSTPEYLAPEILEFLENRGSSVDGTAAGLFKRLQPWSFDVWSLGTILIEMLTGFPIWMSLKCRVGLDNGKSVFGKGVFGVPGRCNKKIQDTQHKILKNILSTIKKNGLSFGLEKNDSFMNLLQQMLNFAPSKRISPADALSHDFIKAVA
jgi:mitogen-activated protein kinase 15